MEIKVEKVQIMDDNIIMTTCYNNGKKESVSFEIVDHED